MDQSSNLFVIEGSDGTGKTTQLALLTKRLQAAGYDVVNFSFPRYSEPSSYFIKSYLAGHYGTAQNVGPYAAALFYALDRYEASSDIREALQAGKIVLIDRYSGSNLAHQGGKFTNPEDRRGFYLWLDSLEHQILHLPRPKKSLVLSAPTDITQALIFERGQKSSQKPDIHEVDVQHLEATANAYDELCTLFPEDYHRIDCARGGKLLSKQEVSDLLWNSLEPLLPAPESTQQQAYTPPLVKPPLLASTNAGSRDLKLELKSVSGLVTNQLRQSNITVSHEPLSKPDYYIPSQLDKKTTDQYRKVMNQLLTSYQRYSSELHDFEAVLPLAYLQNVWVEGDLQSLKAAIIELVASPLQELQIAGQKLFEQLYDYQNHGLSLSEVTIPLEMVHQKRATNQQAATLAQKNLNTGFGDTSTPVRLVRSTPRNEMELLPELLYCHSNASYNEINHDVAGWSYQQKSQQLVSLLATAPLELSQVSYELEILAPIDELFELKTQLDPLSIRLQSLTARYGFEVPSSIEHSDACDEFENCFDSSFALIGSLQSTNNTLSAYGILRGHKARARVIITGDSRQQLLQPTQPTALSQKIRDLLCIQHPLLYTTD